jgi:type II secretory pathway pseudopilin PulG
MVAAFISWKQKRDGERAASAAERSAQAAEQSAETASKGERAWILVQEVVNSSDLRGSHIVFRVVVTLKNTGKTPALRLRTWQNMEIREAPPLQSDWPGTLTEGTCGAIPPGEPLQITAILEPSAVRYGAVVSHQNVLFIYGLAQYDDIIFNRQDNKTWWCLQYVPETKQFTYSATGNRIT